MKLLLSDGSSLASRQAAGLLARAGHEVGVLSDDRWALTSWTGSVRRRHPCPVYGPDPLAWVDVALATAADGGYDVLVPTQEQAAALSAAADRVAAAGVRTAVPPFAALAAVQDKATATATLDRLGIPQPPTTVVAVGDVAGWDRFPVFAKRPVATASTGVALCPTPADLAAFAATVGRRIGSESPAVGRRIGSESASDGLRIVLQEPADGPLAMVQTVWCRGELVAAHVNERVLEGAGGGAARKRSLARPDVVGLLARLGTALGWHGALCADVILAPTGPVVIDVNPRLVEPANAAASGVDLVGALVEAAFDRPAPQPPSTPHVETHQLLLAVGGAAQRGEGRRGVLREVIGAGLRRSPYRGSTEELTPARGDLRTVPPLVAVVGACLIAPSAWDRISGGSVAGYALTPEGWRQLVTHAAANGCAIEVVDSVG